MKMRLLFLYIICLALIAQPASAQDAASDLLIRINNLRASLGLYVYSYNGALAAAAQNQAQWMAETGEVAHVRPDGSAPRDRALAAGYGTTAVSENIYAGSMAGVDDAWNFWINSSIHYAGLTSTYYSEIGIGAATTSWGSAFALVFGNPGGPPPAMPALDNADSGGGGGDGASVAAAPPSYVMGVDENGNIMHQVQPGDTIGYIALLYGYTWDDIPALLALNGMADARELEEGAIFLVLPHDGTYTPAPSNVTPTDTPTIDAAAQEAQLTADAGRVLTAAAFATYTVTPLPRLPGANVPLETPTATTDAAGEIRQAALAVTPTAALDVTPSASPTLIELTTVAMLPTNSVASGGTSAGGISPWIIAAIGLQLGVLMLAGGEYVLRGRRKKK
jgi:hypothetical protein